MNPPPTVPVERAWYAPRRPHLRRAVLGGTVLVGALAACAGGGPGPEIGPRNIATVTSPPAPCRVVALESYTSTRASEAAAKININFLGASIASKLGPEQRSTITETFQRVSVANEACGMLLQASVCLASGSAAPMANELMCAISAKCANVRCNNRAFDFTGFWLAYSHEADTRTLQMCISIDRAGDDFTLRGYDPDEDAWDEAPDTVLIPMENGFEIRSDDGSHVVLPLQGDVVKVTIEDESIELVKVSRETCRSTAKKAATAASLTDPPEYDLPSVGAPPTGYGPRPGVTSSYGRTPPPLGAPPAPSVPPEINPAPAPAPEAPDAGR